jgi:flagellar biosynthesis/type III secretory pathway M-ring protein FliF/YscJ
MGDLVRQFREMMAGLSLVRKISMVLVLGLSVGAIFYLVQVTNKTSMEPLFTNLNAEDMGTIQTNLDKQNVR